MKQISVRLQLEWSRCVDCLERGYRFWPLRKHLAQIGLGKKRSQFSHHLTNLALCNLCTCALEEEPCSLLTERALLKCFSAERTLGLFSAIAQRFEPLTCCRVWFSAAITRATIVDPSSQSDDLLGPGTRDFATPGTTFHGKIHKCPVSTVAFELGWPTKPRSSKKAALNKESETIWGFQKPSLMTQFDIERSCPTSWEGLRFTRLGWGQAKLVTNFSCAGTKQSPAHFRMPFHKPCKPSS